MPTPDPIPLWQRVFWRVVWFVGLVVSRLAFRLRASGHRRLPRREPYLLLPNHTSFFDPLWVALPVWRPVRFMASEHLFRLPGLTALLHAIGAFPKKKFVSDGRSVVALLRFLRRGAVVLLFPEGSRTWDGRTQPVLPGLGRLIRAARTPVVYARVTTGHYVQPRWARYPRFVPVHVEYDGPHTYDDDPAAIEADAQRRITVDPEVPPPRGSFGIWMAHGLERYLWACPHCFALAGLHVHPHDANAVRCERCGAAWSVDVAQRLTPHRSTKAAIDPTTVARAYDRVLAHFGSRPVADADALSAHGVYLEGEGDLVAVGADGRHTPIRRGRLVLREREIEAHDDGPDAWSAPLDAVSGLSLEAGSVLQLRVRGQLFQLLVERPSTIAWHHFIESSLPKRR